MSLFNADEHLYYLEKLFDKYKFIFNLSVYIFKQ